MIIRPNAVDEPKVNTTSVLQRIQILKDERTFIIAQNDLVLRSASSSDVRKEPLAQVLSAMFKSLANRSWRLTGEPQVMSNARAVHERENIRKWLTSRIDELEAAIVANVKLANDQRHRDFDQKYRESVYDRVSIDNVPQHVIKGH